MHNLQLSFAELAAKPDSKKPIAEMSKEEKLAERNKRIRNDYHHLTKIKHLDAMHVVDVILADKYLPLETSTIWRIVRQRPPYQL